MKGYYINDKINFLWPTILGSARQTLQAIAGFSLTQTYLGYYTLTKFVEQAALPPQFGIKTIAQFFLQYRSSSQFAFLLAALQWTKCSWIITPFILTFVYLIHNWPRRRPGPLQPGETRSFYIIERRLFLKGLFWLEKSLLPASLVMTLVSYIGLLFTGHTIIAISALSTLLISYLTHKNKLSTNFLRTYSKYLNWICLAGILVAGTWLECFILASGVTMMYAMKKPFFWRFVLKKLLPYAISSVKKQPEIEPFKLKNCNISQFPRYLSKLAKQHTEIAGNHIRRELDLLPAQLPAINFNNFLVLFNRIEWDCPDIKALVAKNKREDWISQEAELYGTGITNDNPAKQYILDRNFMRSNLEKFIAFLNQAENAANGQESLARRYAKATLVKMTEILIKARDPKLTEQQKNASISTVFEKIIYLGFATGNYCPLGKAKAIEDCYLDLLNFGELTLQHCVYRIHQIEREQFFHRVYYRDKIFRVLGKEDSLDAYALAVAIFGTKLGLTPVCNDPKFNAFRRQLSNLPSVLNYIQDEFWETLLPESLENQVMIQMNTPLLPIKVIDEWYREFIYNNTEGSQEEKDSFLENNLPYTVEWHERVPIYKLKPEINHLMHLDFGILYLPSQVKVKQATPLTTDRRPTFMPAMPAPTKTNDPFSPSPEEVKTTPLRAVH